MAIVKVTKQSLEQAADIIKGGGVVAFPTETVYGLGTNAFDGEAVRKIFELKGRPSDNPLIVHIADFEELSKISNYQLLITNLDNPHLNPPPANRGRKEGGEIATSLALLAMTKALTKRFWPGPLTLVLPKSDKIPDEVSAGLDTVAIRMPDNEVALELIKLAGVAIAAPSANLSGKPSPTDAQHVYDDFGERVPMILDGGKTEVGLESTVLDLTVSPPVILRRGGVSIEEIREILPDVSFYNHSGEKAKSPGMKYRHYAPKAKLFVADGEGAEMVDFINKFILDNKNLRVGVLATLENLDKYKGACEILNIGNREELEECARNLFTALRKFDNLNVDMIIVENFPEEGIGRAIMDRLRKAAI